MWSDIDPAQWPAWVVLPIGALYLGSIVVMLWGALKLALRSSRAIMDDDSRDPVLFYGYLHQRRMRQLAWADRDVRIAVFGWLGYLFLGFVSSLLDGWW